MSWVKLDDGFPDHPKILAAGALAGFLWTCGLAYCNRQKVKTGFIPETKVPVLFPLPQPMKLAAKLVAVGLWERADDGFQVHDYHDFQPSENLRAARSEAGKLGGARSGQVRRSKQAEKQLASPIEATSKQVASGNEATANQELPETEAFASNPGPLPDQKATDLAEADASAPILVPLDDLLAAETAEEITARTRKEQRAYRLPKDFPLTEALRKIASDNGCRDPETMHAAFLDYWRGTGRPMVDWTATYRRWARDGHCGNAIKACACFKGRHTPVHGSVTSAEIVRDRMRAAGDIP